MDKHRQRMSASTPAQRLIPSDPIPSSSPAFGTPARPFKITNKPGVTPHQLPKASVLPILLPPSTLRPIAFRTFTRKHNLTISSPALQTLAVFVGKHCGSGWREEGLAERVLDEVAKAWKKAGGGVIVEEGKGASLKTILQTLEGSIHGGRLVVGKIASLSFDDRHTNGQSAQGNGRAGSGTTSLRPFQSATTSAERNNDDEDESDISLHFRSWIKVLGAFDLPRLSYNAEKKYFETVKGNPTLFPPPSHKTALFRNRYNLVYQRLLRNEAFQTSSLEAAGVPSLQRSASSFAAQQSYKLTPIANLLGRSGTSHLLLGLLSISPAGDLSLIDLTGSVSLDLSHARIIPEDGAWFAPGMIVLVDGIYEEEDNVRGSTLGGNHGVGGAIGGRFVGVSICGPPCERRDVSLGTVNRQNSRDISSSGGFGWVDFLGVGSERAQGPRMRRIQSKCMENEGVEVDGEGRRPKIAILGEVNLDNMKVLEALKKVLGTYSDMPVPDRPAVFILMGNFVRTADINGGGRAGSIEYKEYFDSLASVLSEYSEVLQRATFIFVPGDHDPWASAFSAGASTPIPRDPIPELFTSRVKRAFANANADLDRGRTNEPPGEAIWTTNPSRLTLFGPVHDIAIFRDDMTGRLRRTSVMSSFEAVDETDVPMSDDTNESTTTTNNNNNYNHHLSNPVDDNNHHQSTSILHPTSPSATQHTARKLVKTVLDQGTLSPFPLAVRPVLWDFASALHLYPLPSALVLADAEAAPFCVTYEGCHVMNPGRMVPEGDLSVVRWVEFDVLRNRGRVREERY